MHNNYKKIFNKLSASAFLAYVTLTSGIHAYAAPPDQNWGISLPENADSTSLAQNLISTVSDIAYPLGGAIIFISVIISGIMIVINHMNPNKRSESMSGILWIGVGGIVLGLALTITGLIIHLASPSA